MEFSAVIRIKSRKLNDSVVV